MCRYFAATAPDRPVVASVQTVADPYYRLGTHPDLVERLWDQLTGALPVDCRVALFGSPALIEPHTATVFAFAGGTHTYALRLPTRERDEAIRAGATRVRRYPNGDTLDLDAFGPAWVFGGWFRDEPKWHG